MFNHIRSRNRAAAVFLILLVLFVLALVTPRPSGDLTIRIIILVFSLGATLISAVWLIIQWDNTRRLIRLCSGKGILARWTVDPARWEWFRGHSNEWDKRAGVRPNDANLAQNPGNAGIEIIVTLDGILIGTDFRPLEVDVRITVSNDWIEFYQIIPKASGSALRMVLRLPLEAGKESLASEVQQSYQRAYLAARSSFHPKVYVALIFFVGLPAVTVLVWFIATLTGWTE